MPSRCAPPAARSFLQEGVNLFHQGGGEIAPGRPGLVGDHHHLDPGRIEAADGRDRLGQQ